MHFRLQNRIAQRNHRKYNAEISHRGPKCSPKEKKRGRSLLDATFNPPGQRLKETIQVATSDDGNESQKEDDLALEPEQAPSEQDQAPYHQPPDNHTRLDFAFIDPQLRSSREGSSSSSTVMDGNFLGNTMPQKQHSPSWMGVDQMMMMNMPPVSDALMSHHQPPASYSSCTCNSVTGPCPGHLDKIRSDMMSSTASSSPMQHMQQLQQSHHHHASITNLGMAFPQTQSQQYPIPSPNSHVSSPRRSAPSTTSSSSLLPGSRSPSVSGHRSLHEESTSSSSVPSSTAGQFTTTSSSTGTAREPSPAVTGNQGATGGGVTSRFKTILEATKAAGFADFDKMVVAYYTTQFERSSIAASKLSSCSYHSQT